MWIINRITTGEAVQEESRGAEHCKRRNVWPTPNDAARYWRVVNDRRMLDVSATHSGTPVTHLLCTGSSNLGAIRTCNPGPLMCAEYIYGMEQSDRFWDLLEKGGTLNTDLQESSWTPRKATTRSHKGIQTLLEVRNPKKYSWSSLWVAYVLPFLYYASAPRNLN